MILAGRSAGRPAESSRCQFFPRRVTVAVTQERKREGRMPTRNVNLTEHHDRFVENQIAQGHYKNASEVMRAGLRLLEQQTRADEAKLAALRKLAAEAFDELDRGNAISLEDDEQLEAFISRAGERASQRAEGR